MEILRITPDHPLWEKTIEFAQACSWAAGKHVAELLRENRFTDWEAFFVAAEDGAIIGFCSFLKEDYYPENRYSPWVSSVFVTESARGNRLSHKMIEAVLVYAKNQGFSRVYLPSDMDGFYEKCGFQPIDTLQNYGGDMDTIYMRQL